MASTVALVMIVAFENNPSYVSILSEVAILKVAPPVKTVSSASGA